MPGRIDKGLDSSLALIMSPSHQRRLMFAIATGVAICAAVAAPFGAIQLAPVDSFVPVTQSWIVICDLLTAYLLLTQARIMAAPSFLLLGSGYLFSAIIVVSHTLTFPGAFAPSGLLNAGLQTSGWLYIAWHLGLPISVVAFTLLEKSTYPISRAAIVYSAGSVIGLALTLSVLAVRWSYLLPTLFVDRIGFTSFANYVTAIDFAVAVFALLTILTRGTKSLITGWATVAMIALVAELAAVTFIIGGRFTVGFYVGRSLSVIVSLVVLLALLAQIVGQDVRLTRMNMALQIERHRRLMTVDAALSAIAHELKQPLTAIGANAQAMQIILQNDSEHNWASIKEIADDIFSDVFRADAVLVSIRDLFKSVPNDTGPVNVNDIVGQVLRIFRDRIHHQSVAVDVRLGPRLPTMIGNKAQFQEVVFNVVQNALDAVEGVSPDMRRVSVRTEQGRANEVLISVEDNGPGIADGQLAHIFEAFVTTKQNGMGMGLAISRRIVERHGGELRASRENNQTRFDIILPAPVATTLNRSHSPVAPNAHVEGFALE